MARKTKNEVVRAARDSLKMPLTGRRARAKEREKRVDALQILFLMAGRALIAGASPFLSPRAFGTTFVEQSQIRRPKSTTINFC
jgi:hypothetical protein